MKREQRCSRGDDELGSLAVELVVLTPIVILFALMALALGRLEIAHEQVVGAARAAAEAASVVPSATDAQAAALTAATPVVADQIHSCADLNVTSATQDFGPGGSVQVTVSCQVDFDDLFVPGLPGHVRVEAVARAPIDPFRAVQ